MPFGPRAIPSLGLSLLKSLLAEAGHSVRVRYLTMDFAATIGGALYDRLALSPAQTLIGDWIFAAELFENTEARDALFEVHVVRPYGAEFAEGARVARAHAPAAVGDAVAEIVRAHPAVVGFTTMFAQNVASLAVAKRVKAAAPDTIVVFGGANCENEMGIELVRSFPFVDAAVSGEGEAAILALVDRLERGVPFDDLPGVHTQANCRGTVPGVALRTETLVDLDRLPFPDFGDFMERSGTAAGDDAPAMLLFEASRGCWWGAKQHCTFCGLNGAMMQFRSKSPVRVIDELRHLRDTYGVSNFGGTDNILDFRYFDTLLPKLVEEPLGISLFFEVKANLKKCQVALLRAAGVRSIQPGIESLDSGVLRLMRKGVTGLANVQLMKWCKEFDIELSWNLLTGFSGEAPEAYARMAGIIPLLEHLTPPEGAAQIRIDRFSPNFTDPEAYGFVDVRPWSTYAWVYDVPDASLANLAYYFSCEYADGRNVAEYTGAVSGAVEHWRRSHGSSELAYVELGEAVLVLDSRTIAPSPWQVLSGLDARTFLACDAAMGRGALLDELRSADGDVTEAALDAALLRLAQAKLTISEDGKTLSLPVRLTDPARFPSLTGSLGLAAALLPSLRSEAAV